MKEDYKLKGRTVKYEGIEVEAEVLELMTKMENYSKLTRSEITNTALKRFISQHKDFLPPDSRSKSA